jgi:hypothetical protein
VPLDCRCGSLPECRREMLSQIGGGGGGGRAAPRGYERVEKKQERLEFEAREP